MNTEERRETLKDAPHSPLDTHPLPTPSGLTGLSASPNYRGTWSYRHSTVQYEVPPYPPRRSSPYRSASSSSSAPPKSIRSLLSPTSTPPPPLPSPQQQQEEQHRPQRRQHHASPSSSSPPSLSICVWSRPLSFVDFGSPCSLSSPDPADPAFTRSSAGQTHDAFHLPSRRPREVLSLSSIAQSRYSTIHSTLHTVVNHHLCELFYKEVIVIVTFEASCRSVLAREVSDSTTINPSSSTH